MSEPRRTRPAVERMEGVDAGFLYLETPVMHMHTLKIAILEGTEHTTFEGLQAGVLSRLKRLPPMRRRVVRVPWALNHPVWVTGDRIDPAKHFFRHQVGGTGSMRDLEVLIGEISGRQLDRSVPLWELHVCEGLEGGRVAIVGKMHHALADGNAANQLLGNVTDVRSAEPAPTTQEDFAVATGPLTTSSLVVRALVDATLQIGLIPGLLVRTARGVRAVVRYRRSEVVDVPLPVRDAPRVSFSGPLTARRTFATVAIPLADMKAVRVTHPGTTLNDLVLAMVSGALRQWLELHDEHPLMSLTAGVPTALDGGAAPRLGGNRVSNLFTTLATDVDDPGERLAKISRITGQAKRLQLELGATMMVDWTQFAPPAPFAAAVRLYSRLRGARLHRAAFTVIVSNVPGPREPATIGGARLADLFSVGPLVEGIGLNVTVWSYVDTMNFSLLACPDLLPDVEVLAAMFPAALEELAEAGRASSGGRPAAEQRVTG